MKKPLIGISSNEQANFDGWFNTHYIHYTKSETIKVIDDVGGIPIIIPVLENDEHIDSYLELIDGLILTGGHDVSPSLYNEDTRVGCGKLHPKTDYFDTYLINAALKKKIPTIVICRGVQITNVAFGGTLTQDIYQDTKSTIKHHAPEDGNLPVHSINIIDKYSLFSKLLNEKDSVVVNSIHHQTIKELAPIFKKVACSSDGVIEVIELKNSDQFFIGTQFHPEILASHGNKKMYRLFEEMINYILELK